ncbi:YciI family protein [Actinoplanes sp. DH11]|uniref:YciI family protein n=1 Tax=Actinoplanes sp. DH11 TaxID=2857011 RepID=UPI001E374832|nr:YciI family protein [Actinoplanes sp. DH11]
MISKYLKPLAEVDAAREDHLAFVAGLEERGLSVTAGRQDPPAGGVILLDVDTEAEAHAAMAEDPYVLRGLAEYTATGWIPTRGALAGYERVRRDA